ncbi:unnamed protein product, partial [marine sediment metagenome]
LLHAQWENGMIPSMVHVRSDLRAKEARRELWRALKRLHFIKAFKTIFKIISYRFQDKFFGVIHSKDTYSSGITQPPLIADAVWKIYEKTPDKNEGRKFLEETFGSMCDYYNWLDRERDKDKDGLITIYHSWETGADNSPRFDPIYGAVPKKFREWSYNLLYKFPVMQILKETDFKSSPFKCEAIDMNCYYYKNLKTLAKIAEELGENETAQTLLKRTDKTKKAILTKLWDKENEMFCDLGVIKGRKT